METCPGNHLRYEYMHWEQLGEMECISLFERPARFRIHWGQQLGKLWRNRQRSDKRRTAKIHRSNNAE